MPATNDADIAQFVGRVAGIVPGWRTHTVHRRISRYLGLSIIVAMATLAAFACPAMAGSAGTVQTLRDAPSSFNEYTGSPTPATEAWMRAHFWRMVVFSPYFDTRTSWYPHAWFYKDAYAIYNPSLLATEHPEWIFKDSHGNKLYIPFGCANGSCTQYAGNIANAGFRQHWIEEARATLAHGYQGLYIDDVNMEFNVCNGNGEHVVPIDPATGQPMTYTAWRAYMAQFMEQIRAAFPGTEIVHNAIWFAAGPARISDPYVDREIDASSGVYLERGVNDGGLTGGSGEWSLNAFLSYAEGVNALGRFFVLGNASTNAQGRSYDLASYFLISNGNDAIDVGTATPTEWWPGWEVQLGQARGARYEWRHLLRRDFTGGSVLVNPPDSETRTVALRSTMLDENGNKVKSVTLPPDSGAILRTLSSHTETSPPSGESTPPPGEPTEGEGTEPPVEPPAETTPPPSEPPPAEGLLPPSEITPPPLEDPLPPAEDTPPPPESAPAPIESETPPAKPKPPPRKSKPAPVKKHHPVHRHRAHNRPKRKKARRLGR